MRRASIGLGFVLCVLPWAAFAQTTVETYTATYTINVTLPGTPSGGNVDFSGAATVTSLDFAPGAVTFQGQPVDFDGTEASFLASTYSGSGTVPSVPSTTQTATGTGTSSGGVNSNWIWFTDLDLGAGFSASNYDIGTGTKAFTASTSNNWNSTLVPALNGKKVTTDVSQTVNSVDPINGIVDASGSGAIIVEDRGAAVPALSLWGLALMAAGLLGGGVLLARRGPARV